MEQTKICTKCGIEKSLSEFRKFKRCKNKFTIRADCKICEIKKKKEWECKNKQKVKEYKRRYDKKYKAKNYEVIKEQKNQYRKKNRTKINNYRKNVIDKLTDFYIAQLLGLPLKECPPELIETKRAQIKLHRLIKEMSD